MSTDKQTATKKEEVKVAYEAILFEVGTKGHLPTKGSAGAAGYDVYSAESTTVPAGKRKWVSTDLKMAVPATMYCKVEGRSGNSGKNIDVGAGVIDSDYRGEPKVLMINHGDKDFEVTAGDRIAQFLFIPLAQVLVTEVKALSSTERGTGGFGSTGV